MRQRSCPRTSSRTAEGGVRPSTNAEGRAGFSGGRVRAARPERVRHSARASQRAARGWAPFTAIVAVKRAHPSGRLRPEDLAPRRRWCGRAAWGIEGARQRWPDGAAPPGACVFRPEASVFLGGGATCCERARRSPELRGLGDHHQRRDTLLLACQDIGVGGVLWGGRRGWSRCQMRWARVPGSASSCGATCWMRVSSPRSRHPPHAIGPHRPPGDRIGRQARAPAELPTNLVNGSGRRLPGRTAERAGGGRTSVFPLRTGQDRRSAPWPATRHPVSNSNSAGGSWGVAASAPPATDCLPRAAVRRAPARTA